MKMSTSRRAVIETILAVATGLLAVMTALWPDWIELVFGIDPDGGDGSLERIIVIATALVTIGLAAAARRSWKSSRLVSR
jgi:hypothetical protein